jgi:Fe2+ or Zn2+ uptake regulation protein
MVVMSAPFSAEDVYSSPGPRPPRRDRGGRRPGGERSDFAQSLGSIDLVTVYRTLTTLTELGVLNRVDLDDGVVRYELTDPKGQHHHHFVCRSCQKIESLDACASTGPIQSQERRLAKKGYTFLSHRLEFFGLCPKCSNRNSKI